MDEGIAVFESIENPNEKLQRMINLGKYIANCVTTNHNAKQFYILKCRMNAEFTKDGLNKILDEMEALCKKIKEIDLKAIKDTFEELGTDKSKLGLSLIDEATFMKTTLNDLKKIVEDQGVVTSMCQGKYNIDRANPALSQYSMYIKNFNTLVNSIANLLPKEEPVQEDIFDEL